MTAMMMEMTRCPLTKRPEHRSPSVPTIRLTTKPGHLAGLSAGAMTRMLAWLVHNDLDAIARLQRGDTHVQSIEDPEPFGRMIDAGHAMR